MNITKRIEKIEERLEKILAEVYDTGKLDERSGCFLKDTTIEEKIPEIISLFKKIKVIKS